MNPFKHNRHARGAALVAAFIAMVIFATMAISLSTISMSNSAVLNSSQDRMQALLLAQAGMNMAISRTRMDVNSVPSGLDLVKNPRPTGVAASQWSQNLNFTPNHMIRIDRENVNGSIRLVAWGIVHGQVGGTTTYTDPLGVQFPNATVRRIEALLQPAASEGAFQAGAFGDDSLIAHGNITTDSYDSRGVPIMKLNPAYPADPSAPQYIPEMGSVGRDGIAGTSDDAQSKGPDGILGTADDILFPRFTPATYNQQVHIAPRLKGPPPRPNTLLDPVTAAELGGPNVAYTAAELTAFRSTTAGNNGDVGTNGTSLSAVGALIIFGDASPGPGGSVTGGGTITGSTAPAPQPWVLNVPTITVPTTGITGTSATATMGSDGNNTTYVLSSWSSMDVTVRGNVTVFLTGNFQQSGQKAITIASGGKLTVYQTTGTFTLNGGGVVNGSNKKPADFTLISTSTSEVKLAGGAEFYGTVYAPNAPVKVIGNADSYGAIVGNTIDLGGTADFHYDTSATSPGIVESMNLVSYREMD